MKKKIQSIAIVGVAVLVVGSIVAYNYSVEQTKQKGLQFGIELEQIQEGVKQMQTRFYSEKTSWEEKEITKDELLEFYERHLMEFKDIISRYDGLTPPDLFKSSVDLLKISSEMQLDSDSQFIEWIKTGDESAKIRSDTRFQQSLEYEMLGLVEFYSAKTGVKNYDEDKKFEPPQQAGLTQKVLKVSENMKNECDRQFRDDDTGEFDSDEIEVAWFNCINDAERWKTDHLP